MASWPTFWGFESWTIIWFAVGVILLDLAAGITIGWYARGGSAAFIERRAHARQALNGLKRLHDLTNDVARRVGNHLTRVEEISRRVISLQPVGLCQEVMNFIRENQLLYVDTAA